MPKSATKRANARQSETRKERALALLASGESVAEAARQLKVSPRTVFRWREDPTFAAELSRLLGEVEGEARDRLRALVPAALDRLAAEMNGGRLGVRAAREVLDRTLGRPTQPLHGPDVGDVGDVLKVVYTIPDNGRFVPAATMDEKGGRK